MQVTSEVNAELQADTSSTNILILMFLKALFLQEVYSLAYFLKISNNLFIVGIYLDSKKLRVKHRKCKCTRSK